MNRIITIISYPVLKNVLSEKFHNNERDRITDNSRLLPRKNRSTSRDMLKHTRSHAANIITHAYCRISGIRSIQNLFAVGGSV